MDAFWTGVVAALIGAVVGALLTFLITWFFKFKDERLKDRIIWYGVREEITANYAIAESWLKFLKNEMKALEKNQYHIESLRSFHVDFFNTLIYNLPKELRKDADLLTDLRITSQACTWLNNQDYAKQTFKTTVSMSNEIEAIKDFNKMMIKELKNVIEMIEKHADKLIISVDSLPEELKKIS